QIINIKTFNLDRLNNKTFNLKILATKSGLVFYVIISAIILNYLFDGVNKFSRLNIPLFSRSAIVYRIFLVLVAISIIIVFLNKKRFNFILLYLFFLICFVISNIYLKHALEVD